MSKPASTRILFISHGGGPLPLLGDPSHDGMIECLQTITKTIKKPSAIVLISAHWEESQPTITAAANPPLIYDYGGFPEEAYHIQYPCPGEPALAEKVFQALDNANLSPKLNTERGFDHGVFVPLKIMYPEADIPCVQLSLIRGLDAQAHINLGKALQQIEHDNLLIIGSGFSFHNMRAFFSPETDRSVEINHGFEAWLVDTCSNTDLSEAERTQRLFGWEQAPFARECHPREEHLMPLHVCYAIAEAPSTTVYERNVLNKKVSMYYWE